MNPYIVGNPVSGDFFYSRKDIIKKFCQVDKPGRYALFGLRRMGKTSILLQTQVLLNQASKRVFPVFISLQGIENASVFLLHLKSTIEDNAIQLGDKFDEINNHHTFESICEAWVKFCMSNHYKAYLLIDEVDQLAEYDKNFISEMYNALNLSNQHCIPNVVITGTQRFFRKKDYSKGLEDFLNLFIEEYIGGFDECSTEDLIKQTNEPMSVESGRDLNLRIYQLTGGYPYLIQYLCSQLYDSTQNKLRQPESLNLLPKEFINLLFKADFESLSLVQKSAITYLAEGKLSIDELARKIKRRKYEITGEIRELEELGIIHVKDEAYEIKSSLFQDYVNAIQKNEPAISYNKDMKLTEVFPRNGTPMINFVEPAAFEKFKTYLSAEDGRSILIEGPSGVGKTTLVKKAFESLGKRENIDYLYIVAKKVNANSIDNLINDYEMPIVIDDFHCFDETGKDKVADYIKDLAEKNSLRKLILIGIPMKNRLLISRHDIATRMEPFPMHKVENSKIFELITLGEKALNIEFERETKEVIVNSANGSFIVAQFLCYYAAEMKEIYISSRERYQIKDLPIKRVIEKVKKVFLAGFDGFIQNFVSLFNADTEAGIKLLQAMAADENGCISLDRMIQYDSHISNVVKPLLQSKELGRLIQNNKLLTPFLFFEPGTNELIVDDRKILFYLSQTTSDELRNLTRSNRGVEHHIAVLHASDTRQILDEFKKHCTNPDKWHFSDLHISNSHTVLEREIRMAEIVLVFFSTDFFVDSLKVSQLQETLKNCKFIPILAKSSSYTNYFPNDHVYPRNKKDLPHAIEKWGYRSDAYSQVCKAIKELTTTLHP